MLEILLRRFPVDYSAMRARINEIAVASEIEYENLAGEYLGSSVKISKDLELPYHEEMARRRECLGGCCYRNRVDLFIDTLGGENKSYFHQNNFRIADIAFLTYTQGAIEDLNKRLEGGSFSRDESSFFRERLKQLEEYQHSQLQHVYSVNGVKPQDSKSDLYKRFYEGIAKDEVCQNIEMGKVLYRRNLLFDRNISDVYAVLGNLSMQIRDTR